MKKVACLAACLLTGTTNAALIAEYDFLTASGTTHAASSVDSNFTATDLTVVNPSNTVSAFSNHFYMNGWDTSINLNKYYETTISSSSNFSLSAITFSLEELNGSSSDWFLRTSLDTFATDFDTGTFGGGANAGLVTDFSVDASTLGLLSSPITLRWYITADNATERAGFASHLPGGDGGGMADVGQNLRINGTVPEPASLALIGLGLAGMGFSRKKKKT